MRFRKKPTVVEAEQFQPGAVTRGVCLCSLPEKPGFDESPHVHTAQGQRVPVLVGEWIIAEPDGRGFYPCAPDIFEATYDPAE